MVYSALQDFGFILTALMDALGGGLWGSSCSKKPGTVWQPVDNQFRDFEMSIGFQTWYSLVPICVGGETKATSIQTEKMATQR